MNFNCQNEETLIMKSEGFIRQYYLSNIVYINGSSYLSTIYLADSDHRGTYSVLVGKLEEQLRPYFFFRINRNILVNLRYIRQLRQSNGRPCVILANGDEFSIAHRRISGLRRIFTSAGAVG